MPVYAFLQEERVVSELNIFSASNSDLYFIPLTVLSVLKVKDIIKINFACVKNVTEVTSVELEKTSE